MVSLRDRIAHHLAQQRMSDYVDGEPSARRRQRIERHAERCRECGPLRRTLERLTAALRDLRRSPTRSIAPNVIRRLRESDREHSSGDYRAR
jgi:anti-sigma factor RsiW